MSRRGTRKVRTNRNEERSDYCRPDSVSEPSWSGSRSRFQTASIGVPQSVPSSSSLSCAGRFQLLLPSNVPSYTAAASRFLTTSPPASCRTPGNYFSRNFRMHFFWLMYNPFLYSVSITGSWPSPFILLQTEATEKCSESRSRIHLFHR